MSAIKAQSTRHQGPITPLDLIRGNHGSSAAIRGNHGSSTANRGNHGSSAAIRAHTVCRWRAPPHEAWWFGRCRCRVARLADVRLDRGERCGAHLSNDRAAPGSLLKLVAREACPCERIEERRLPRRGLAHESDAIGPADEGGHQRRNQRRPS